MSFAFDTLKAAQRLNAAGFSEEQASSLATTFAEGITENLATKDDIVLVHKEVEVLGKDIKALDTKIDTSVAGVQKDIAALDTKIDTSIAGVQKDIAALDTKIDTSIDKLRGDMTIRLGGIVVGGITVLKVIENL